MRYSETGHCTGTPRRRLVNTSGISMVDSDGADGTLLFTGTQSAINAVLRKGVTPYTPTRGFNGEATLTLGREPTARASSSTAQVVHRRHSRR